MQMYNLQASEVQLFKGTGFVDGHAGRSDVLLTNLTLALVMRIKKMFSKEQKYLQTFSMDSVKQYNGVPQIVIKGEEVELFFVLGQPKITFDSKSEARSFYNAAFELVSGKTMAELQAEKVRGTVDLIDKALGIDTVGAIKHVAENGVVGTIVGGVGRIGRGLGIGGAALSVISGITGGLFDKADSSGEQVSPAALIPPSHDAQIETLKRFKELLDSGVITQEEFEQKKAQIMEL